MDAFVHLYLGHLFGDYVLQNGWIATKKSKSKIVLLIHVLLVVLSHVVFAFGVNFRLYQFLAVLGIGALHYITDMIKIEAGPRGWIGYIIDQTIHVLIIIIFLGAFKDISFWLPTWVSIRFAFSIFNAYLIGILFHIVFNDEGYKRDIIGYIFRAVLPWIGSVWAELAVFAVGLWACGSAYGWKRDMIYSMVTSAALTTIWGVFL